MSTAPIPLSSLRLNGQDAKRHYADLIEAVASLRMTETITGASTVEIGLLDPKRKILQSAALTAKSTIILDRAAFELVKVSKQGTALTATFEDLNVARLRRHTSYRSASPGTVSRPGFVQALIREEPDIKVVTGTGADKTLVQVARGTGNPTKGRSKVGAAGDVVDSGQEDTWTAGGRILGEIGWRLYCYRGVIYQASDAWLLAHNGKPYKLSPDSKGVIDIDVDWDTGKPAAAATLYVNAGAHDLAPGTPLSLSGLGPGNGTWLVESIERSPFTTDVTVNAIRAEPTLPEPKNATVDLGDLGVTGYNGDYLGEGELDPPTIEHIPHVSVTDVLNTEGARGSTAERFVAVALAQRGKPYVYGASGPNSWDCSGFVQWCAAQVGLRISKPVSSIAATCRHHGTDMTVAQAAYTRGALLWHERGGGMNDHVVISLGNGEETIEAMGVLYGVVRGKIKHRQTPWTGAGYVPGMDVHVPALRDLRPG